MKIKLLSDNVINQIAAGEVVERPASVVRELVDNAIDAGATKVSIYLEDGGKQLIRVVDNGCGMSRDDALLACERHATSKISTEESLNDIRTMGFRGEALSSIAAVSRFKLITRTAEDALGTEVSISGGKLTGSKAVSAPVGSDLSAANLFFNIPARKKFLKQPSTEEQRVKQWVLQSSLANPMVHYRIESAGRELLNLPPAKTMIERGERIFRGSSVSFENDFGALRIKGLLCHPSLAQCDTKSLVVLVNRRVVSDRTVIKAVREGFSTTLKDSEYPLGFVSIEMPPSEVDVNVHPQKSEVRFRSAGDVFLAVKDAVSRAVQNFSGPVFSAEKAEFRVNPSNSYKPNPNFDTLLESFGATDGSVAYNTTPEPTIKYEAQPLFDVIETVKNPEKFCFSKLKYIGQALLCYLFCEADGVLYVVDMHAAHERCNYNKIKNQFAAKAVESQILLVPISVTLTEDGVRHCLERKELLNNFGFEIEAFGDRTLLVRAVPSILEGSNVEAVIKEVAALEEGVGLGFLERQIDYIAARIACHSSIRSGYKIEREEVYSLFEMLDSEEFSSACPHGRPVIVSFKQAEIEKWFGRDR